MKTSFTVGLKSTVEEVISKKHLHRAQRVYSILKSLKYFGFNVVCPICNGHFRKFLTYDVGYEIRHGAICPRCGSLERHRSLYLYLRDETNFFTDHLKVLDVAPTHSLREKFSESKNLDYLAVSIEPSEGVEKMSIIDIRLPENQFDYIICYHVLEHVPDDMKAVRELFRVLKPGGRVLIETPVDYNSEKTVEDPRIASDTHVGEFYRQSDHVRIYGRDFKDRLGKGGFIVEPVNYVRELGGDKIRRYGLLEHKIIYCCTKPKSGEDKHGM